MRKTMEHRRVNLRIRPSDHQPVTITLSKSVLHQATRSGSTRWRNQGVDWSKFREEVENYREAVDPEGESFKKVVSEYPEHLTKAAPDNCGENDKKREDHG